MPPPRFYRSRRRDHGTERVLIFLIVYKTCRGLLVESKNESSPKQPIEEDNGRSQNVDSADQETPRAEAPPPNENQEETKPPEIPELPSEILSAPKPPEPAQNQKESSLSPVLKTRRDMIKQIERVAEARGQSVKHHNLKRRRKNSLKQILQEQLREAVQAERDGIEEIHPEVQEKVPEGAPALRYACDMALRLDLTLCRVFEHCTDATSKWHGLTCVGFADSIEKNETLCTEIRGAWLEILQEEENQWVLEYCGAGMRLFLAHVYGLSSVLRAKKQIATVPYAPPKIKRQSRPPMETRAAPPEFRDTALFRAAKRKKHAAQEPMPPRARELVKSV